MKRIVIILILVVLTIPLLVSAQGTPHVAFINGSGQLVVASGDGNTRWIVTNPGEFLNATLGFSWSPDNARLFFAVDTGGAVSLRVGDVAGMSIVEIGQVSGNISGGEWTNRGEVLVGSSSGVALYSNNGITPIINSASAQVVTPFVNERPNLAQPNSMAGNSLFFWQDGMWQTQNGALISNNDPNARGSGLWSDDDSMVAYWGTDGSGSLLSVLNVNSGQSITLSTGRSAPVTPIDWVNNSSFLVYRDANGDAKVTDMACLASGCNHHPLESGITLLPASASDAQIVGNRAYYRDGDNLFGVDVGCVNADTCLSDSFQIANNVAPLTLFDVEGDTLVYTAFTSDANNPNDRYVQVVSTNCLPDCAPQTLVPNAVSGLLSPDGQYVVVDVADNGLNIVRISDLNAVYLSGSMGQLGAGLTTARWQ